MPHFGSQYYSKIAREAHEPFRLELLEMSEVKFYDWCQNNLERRNQFQAVLDDALRMHRSKIGELSKEEHEAIFSAVKFELDWYNIDETNSESTTQRIARLEAVVTSADESKWTTPSFAKSLKLLIEVAKDNLAEGKDAPKAKSALEIEHMILSRGYKWRADRTVLEKVGPSHYPSNGALPPRTILGGAFDQNRRRH